MKRFIIFLLFINVFTYSQVEYVPVENSIYSFLDRISAIYELSNYTIHEKPLQKNEIASCLEEIIKNNYELNSVDLKLLKKYEKEFYFDIYGTDSLNVSLIGGKDYSFDKINNRYFYYLNDENANIALNFFGNINYMHIEEGIIKDKYGVFGTIGGEIAGTFYDKFGFLLNGSNGLMFKGKSVSFFNKELRQNFKLNEEQNKDFYDEAKGYFSFNFDFIKIRFGRERALIGYGQNPAILGDYVPLFDHLAFNLNYKFLRFSYMHGKMVSRLESVNDSIYGGYHKSVNKYFAYHRIGFKLGGKTEIGFGEMTIYSYRDLDFIYLNPFNFYKNAEHQNINTDNSFLFFDVETSVIPKSRIFAQFILDDIDYGKIGTKYWANKTLLHLGINSYHLYNVFPMYFALEYMRIEPYFFSHHISDNSYTFLGYPIGTWLQPNSEQFLISLNYNFDERTSIISSFSFVRHGANYYDENYNFVNVGGDRNFSKRINDSDKVTFLDGRILYFRNFSFALQYEPFNKFFLNINVSNANHFYDYYLGKNILIVDISSSIIF